MKAIQINRKDKNLLIKASRILELKVEELKAISTKDKAFFFVSTYNQDDIFKLGIYFNKLCLEANQVKLFY